MIAMSDKKLRRPPTETRPPPVNEMREMLEEYANDLRAIIDMLRKKIN